MPKEAMPEPQTLGECLRIERERAGFSQGKLAEAVEVDKSYITLIESGKRAKPAADVLQRIADVLNIDSAKLLAYLGVKQRLPEPRVYFRRKFGINADQADILAQLVEHQMKKREEEANEEAD